MNMKGVKMPPPAGIWPPTSLSPVFGTAQQASDPTMPAMVTVTIETVYAITIANTQTDTIELRIGPDKTTVENGTGGYPVSTWKSSLTGIALSIGMGQTNRSPVFAALDAGWFWCLRRLVGSTATIVSAYDQAVG